MASLSPMRDDINRIRMENVGLREKLNIKEKTIDQLDKAVSALKKEKEILL